MFRNLKQSLLKVFKRERKSEADDDQSSHGRLIHNEFGMGAPALRSGHDFITDLSIGKYHQPDLGPHLKVPETPPYNVKEDQKRSRRKAG